MGKSSSQLIRSRQDLRNNDDDDNTNKGKRRKMATATATAAAAEEVGATSEQRRQPLSEVVLDCTERWFQDTLKLAKAGDVNMQVLVGQMYYSSYGVAKDAVKGNFWLTKASRVRSSVWKLRNKRPGYNASDSDSDADELADDS